MSLPLLMGLGFALSALIAYWRSSSAFGVDVSRGLAWLFGLLALFGWFMFGYQRVARDRQFEEMWGIAVSVTVMAQNQGLAADSAMHALQDLAKRTYLVPRYLLEETDEPPTVTLPAPEPAS